MEQREKHRQWRPLAAAAIAACSHPVKGRSTKEGMNQQAPMGLSAELQAWAKCEAQFG